MRTGSLRPCGSWCSVFSLPVWRFSPSLTGTHKNRPTPKYRMRSTNTSTPTLKACWHRSAAAEAGDGLNAYDVGLLLELRALVNFGMGDPEAMDRALRALSAARPDHPLTDMSPPAISERFSVLRDQVAPPQVRVEGQRG